MIIIRQRAYTVTPSTTGGLMGMGSNLLSGASDFAKKTWNGDNGFGKFGNRALIVGGGLAAASMIKKKKEENEQRPTPGC